MKNIVCFVIVLCTCTYIHSQTSRKKLLDMMNFSEKSGWSVALKRFDARYIKKSIRCKSNNIILQDFIQFYVECYIIFSFFLM